MPPKLRLQATPRGSKPRGSIALLSRRARQLAATISALLLSSTTLLSQGPPVGLGILDLNEAGVAENVAVGSVGVLWDDRFFFSADIGDGGEPAVSDGTELGSHQIVDLMPGPGGSSISGFVRVGPADGPGSRVIFRRSGSPNSLWATDGTAEGTELVFESPGDGLVTFEAWNGALYIIAPDSQDVPRLHRLDRTTLMVEDLGHDDVELTGSTELEPSDGMLYFVGLSDDGPQVWATAGSGQPSQQTNLACSSIGDLHGVGGELFFVCNTDGFGTLLMQLQSGHPAGASDVYIDGDSRSILQMTATGGLLYFVLGGNELAAYDNSTGFTTTVSVSEAESGISHLTPFAGSLLYTATTASHGAEPRLATGTSSSLLADIRTGPLGSSPTEYTVRDGTTAYFRADDGHSGLELWQSDGSAPGTSLVLDIEPGPESSAPYGLTSTGAGLFFAAGREETSALWRLADGTPPTVERFDQLVNFASPLSELHANEVGERLFLARAEFLLDSGEALISDGTAEGTLPVVDLPDIFPPRFLGVLPSPARDSETSLTLFEGYDNSSWDLWATDGTVEGTELLSDVPSGFSGSQVVDDLLFFIATDAISGRELWVSDGSAIGTGQVIDLLASGDGVLLNSGERSLLGLDGFIHFIGTDGGSAYGLWRSDGTAAGTSALVTSDSELVLVAAVEAGVFYWSPENDGELWTVDAAGITSMIGSSPRPLTVSVGDSGVFYRGADDTFGTELWFATPTTVVRLTDLNPGSQNTSPTVVGVLDDQAIFWGADGSADGLFRLWRIGTSAGIPVPIASFTSRKVGNQTAAQWHDWVYFVASNGDPARQQLWRSDGVFVEAVPLPGNRQALDPRFLTTLGDRLYFTAWDEQLRTELHFLELSLFSDGFESGDTTHWSSELP